MKLVVLMRSLQRKEGTKVRICCYYLIPDEACSFLIYLIITQYRNTNTSIPLLLNVFQAPAGLSIMRRIRSLKSFTPTRQENNVRSSLIWHMGYG